MERNFTLDFATEQEAIDFVNDLNAHTTAKGACERITSETGVTYRVTVTWD